MYHEFATDPKVQMMPENMQRRLVMLCCLHSNETIETLHETELAFALRISEEELAETKKLFLSKNFIDDNWILLSWEERQKPSDSSTPRVKKHREKKKREQETPTEQHVTTHVTDETLHVTNCNGLDKTRPEEIRIDKNPLTPVSENLKDSENGLVLKNDFGEGSGLVGWDILEFLRKDENGYGKAIDYANSAGFDLRGVIADYNRIRRKNHDYPIKPVGAFLAWMKTINPPNARAG